MKRPSFQFYPADWRANAKLRRCSHAERGVWIDLLCLFHDAEEYGVLRWPLADVAQAIGCKLSELRSLQRKGVLKGADEGARCEAFVYTPRHAGKDGTPVELVSEQDGPLWYSSRMVTDEHLRRIRGAQTRFTVEPEASPKVIPMPAPKGGLGDGSGYGASSSSSSTSNNQRNSAAIAGAHAPASPRDFLFREGVEALKAQGVKEEQARSLLGKLVKHRGEAGAAADVRHAIGTGVVGLRDWIGAILKGPSSRQAADGDLGRFDYQAGLPAGAEVAA